MNNRNKYLGLFLAVVLIVISAIPAFGSETDLSSKDKESSLAITDQDFEMDAKKIERQNLAIEAYEKLLEYFDTEGFKDGEYPDYYGGAYINDSEELVIMLVEGKSETITKLSSIADNLKVEKVKYSYNEIMDTINKIGHEISTSLNEEAEGLSAKSVFSDVTGTVLLDPDNSIEVYIKGITDSKTREFKENFENEDIFIFKEAVEEEED